MRPHVACLMMTSLDGRLHPSRWTKSPDGTPEQWSRAYEMLHDRLGADAWMVGRVTMGEMSDVPAHPPRTAGEVVRPVHVARQDAHHAACHAIVIDRSGKLHFQHGDIDGDHVVVLLGAEVPDRHLAELAVDGVSYVVADGSEIALAAVLPVLRERFGIERLLLEGGGTINGSMFAAGLVDEVHILMAPALDGGTRTPGIIEHGEEGLDGKVQLSLVSSEVLDRGLVHLRYRVA